MRAKLVTFTKNLDHQKLFHNFAGNSSLGTVPSGWTGNGIKKVHNQVDNGAMALAGNAISVSGDPDFWRIGYLTTTFPFRDIEVTFNAQYVAPSSSGFYSYYSDGTSDLKNAPEMADQEWLYVQYRLGSSGTWTTANLLTPNATFFPSGANSWESFRFRVHQRTQNLENIEIRVKSKTKSSGNTNFDVWLIDTFKVFTTDDTASNELNSSSGTTTSGATRYTQLKVAVGMWKWDESFTNIYYDNPNAPQGLSPIAWTAEQIAAFNPAAAGDIEPYFQILNGQITQSRAVMLAKCETGKNFTSVTSTTSQGLPITITNEVSRAAKFGITFQNYNPFSSPPANAASFVFNIEPDDVFNSIDGYINGESSNHLMSESAGNRTWFMPGQPDSTPMRVEMQLDYLTIPEFWQSVETFAVVNAFGKARNGSHYIVDSYVFSETKSPFEFTIDGSRQPFDFIQAEAPGINSYDIKINDIRIRAANSDDKAYKYFWGVYRPSGGVNAAAWLRSGFVNGWSDTHPFDLTEGDRLLDPGSHWYTPKNPYNYYGSAGQSPPTNVDIGLIVNTVAWASNQTSNTSTTDRLAYQNWSLKGNLRRGWDFNTTAGSLTNGLSFIMNTDQPNGLWIPSEMKIWADHQDAACHWFKIYVTYKNSNGTTIATDVKTVAGTHATTNPLTESSGKYYREIQADDFMTSSEVNTRFTSVYNNKGYKLKIQVQALNNLNQQISILDTGDLEVSSLFGVPAFDVGDSSTIDIQTNSSGNTATLKHIRPKFARGGSTLEKASYYRVDLFKNNSTSGSNLLAKYYKHFDPNSWINPETGGQYGALFIPNGWTQANNVSDFVNGNGTYVNQIVIGEIPNWNTTYASTTFKARLRSLDDDGNFIDHVEKTTTFDAYQFTCASDTEIQFLEADEIAASPYYNIQTVIKPVTQSNNAFDYATLKVTNSSGTELNFTLPSNGNNIYHNQNGYIFASDNNSSDLDIISLLNSDRYSTSGNTLNYEIKVYAYGFQSPSSQANAISTKTGTFSVGFWSFTFQDSQVFIESNTVEECRISVAFTPSGLTDAHRQIAEKFRLRVWNGNSTYASTAAIDKKEFTLSGSFFSNSQQYRDKTSGGAFIDIVDILGNRYINQDLNFEITAQKNDDTELHSSSGTFTLAPLTWTMGGVQAAIQSDTFNETIIAIQVDKVNSTDSAPSLRIFISEEEVAWGSAGGDSEFAWKEYDLIAEDSPLSKTSNTLSDFFFWNIDTQGNDRQKIDKTQVTKLDISSRAIYRNNAGQPFFLGAHSNRFMLPFTPWWDFNDGNCSVTFNNHTLTGKFVTVNIRGLVDSSGTQNPDHFKLEFFHDGNSVSTTRLFAQAKVDSDDTFDVDISAVYNTPETSQHIIICKIYAYSGTEEHDRHIIKTMTNVPGEPTMSVQIQTTAAILADNGDEYVAVKFKPQISDTNFISGTGQKFHVDFDLNGAAHSIELDGTQDGIPFWAAIPTGTNVFGNKRIAVTHNLDASARYDLARVGSGGTVTGSVNSQDFPGVIHKFPKSGTMTSLTHGFSNTGVSQLSFAFSDGDAEYSNDHSAAYTIQGTVTETVTNAIDTTKVGEQTQDTYGSADLDVNTIAWNSHISNEAMYLSDVTLVVDEIYSNTHGETLGTSTNLDDLNGGFILGSGSPTFSVNVTNTVTYGPFSTVMNDLSSHTNFGILPTEGTIENITGEYGLSGKRIRFKNTTDFDNYYTNSKPYLALALRIGYSKSGNSLSTTGKVIANDKSLIDNASLVGKPLEVKSGSIREISSITKSGEFYVVDFEIDYDAGHTWVTSPDVSQDFTYKLVAYSEEIVTPYDDNVLEVFGSTFADISTWGEINLTPTENIQNSIESYEITPQDIDRVDISTDSTVGKALSTYVYDTPDQSIPYKDSTFVYFNKFTFTQEEVEITSLFDTSDTLTEQTASFSRTISLDVDGYDPTKPLELIAEPHVATRNTVGGAIVNSPKVSTRFFNRTSVNYSDQIIPSFANLSGDDALNEDNTTEGSQTFDFKIFWIYNKDALAGVDNVFTLNQEWVKVTRKVQQGDLVSSPVTPDYYHMYGASVTRTSHSDSTKNKFSITDSSVDITPYSNDGIDTTKPYVFVYEITPVFRYQASNSASHTDVEVPSKSIETFIVPDEFPIAVNSVFDVSNNYNHKHSVEVKWKYRFDQSMMTLASLGNAKVNFEIYSFVDEKESEKSLPSKFKPRKERLMKRKSSWKLLGKKPYTFQTEEDTVTDHRFLVEYDKLESEYNLRIAILVTVESEMFSSLSQAVGNAGASNSFALDVHTSDKKKVKKLFMPDEMEQTSMRHDLINQDFEKLNNLAQVPFSVTRKKAKTRLSKKPYTSST